RRHTRFSRDWSSDVCSSDLGQTVRGTVTSSADNAPIPGVNIVVKGTTTGTTTDVNGDFSIRVKPEDILVFSFIGYHAEEIEVGRSEERRVGRGGRGR